MELFLTGMMFYFLVFGIPKIIEQRAREYLPTSMQAQSLFDHVLIDRKSRKLFTFFMLNLMFMAVEAVYGYLSNSLGLITDAAHMLFDCSSILIGLLANWYAQKQPDQFYTYGYARFEVLAAFTNGVFLIFVAFHVLIECFERIFDPPQIESSQLLLISVLGLLINLIGLTFFHQHVDHLHRKSDET